MTDGARAGFFELYAGLPRLAPGSDASTTRAIRLLPPLPGPGSGREPNRLSAGPGPHIVDLGCGTGRHTLLLARELGGRIDAIDSHRPYLEELAREAPANVRPRCLAMDALDYAPGTIDLIWAEGSIWVLGVERALREWRPLLRPGGAVAFTELAWLTPSRPREAQEFWQARYSDMTDVAGVLASIARQGLSTVATFTLPSEDWWDGYYGPLEEKLARLDGRRDLAECVAAARAEIATYRAHGHSYGYAFFIAIRGP